MNNRAVTLRALAPGDKDDWKLLWRRYLSFYSTIRDDALYEHTFARLTDNAYPSMCGFVAERGGHLVGIANCILHDHGWYQPAMLYLQDLYVDDHVRGQGIGRRLIEEVYRYADREALAGVYWMMQSDNLQAMRLYDKIARKTDFIKYQR